MNMKPVTVTQLRENLGSIREITGLHYIRRDSEILNINFSL